MFDMQLEETRERYLIDTLKAEKFRKTMYTKPTLKSYFKLININIQYWSDILRVNKLRNYLIDVQDIDYKGIRDLNYEQKVSTFVKNNNHLWL